MQILRRSPEAPTRQIAENSSVGGGVVVNRMLTSEGSIGFDAATRQYVDLYEAGIVDPTKVVRVALENAVSVASILLLAEATVTGSAGQASRASAEEAEGQLTGGIVAVGPARCAADPPGQKLNIEAEFPGELVDPPFLRRQQVDEQRGI